MAKFVIFSEEEKLADYRDIALMLMAGWSYTRMGGELGRSTAYCWKIKEHLCAINVITEEDIDKGKKAVDNKIRQELDELVYQNMSSKDNVFDIDIEYFITDIRSNVEQILVKMPSIDSKVKELKQEEKKQKLEIIKKLVKEDKSVTQIHKITGYPASTIKDYIGLLIANQDLKESDVKNENKEQKKQIDERNEKIISLIASNVPYEVIAEKFNIRIPNICAIKRTYEAESPVNKERNEMILALIEFNVPYNVISAIFDLDVKVIELIKRRHDKAQNDLANEKENIEEKAPIKEIDDSLTEIEIDIIKYLKEGYFYTYICKKKKINRTEFKAMINSLKKRNYISQSIINEARSNRESYYKDIIQKLYNDAYCLAEIHQFLNRGDEVEEISFSTVNMIVNKLKIDGLIDEDGIQQLLNSRPESFESVDRMVLDLLPEGLTVNEMIEADETKILTESRVRRSIKRLIESGATSDKKIAMYRTRRKKKIKREQEKEEENRIWYYLETYGFSDYDIAEQIGVSYTYVFYIVKRISLRKKMSVQDLREFRKKAYLTGKSIKFFTYEESLVYRAFQKNKANFVNMYNFDIPTELDNMAYVNSFKELVSCNCSFEKQEVDILSYAVLYTESLCTQDNISIVIMSYLQLNEVESAIQTLNNFISLKESGNQLYVFQRRMMKMINDYQNGKKKRLNILA